MKTNEGLVVLWGIIILFLVIIGVSLIAVVNKIHDIYLNTLGNLDIHDIIGALS